MQTIGSNSYQHRGIAKKSSKERFILSKPRSQRQITERHETALAHRQERARREVPLADERTLNLVFNE